MQPADPSGWLRLRLWKEASVARAMLNSTCTLSQDLLPSGLAKSDVLTFHLAQSDGASVTSASCMTPL